MQPISIYSLKNCELPNRTLYSQNPYFQPKTTRQNPLQIDYIIQVKQDTVYICEIKFSRNPIQKNIIEDMRDKEIKLTLPKNISKRFVLIHVNGVTDDLLDAQFFQYIIDFGELLGLG